jgi:hypothetical protein
MTHPSPAATDNQQESANTTSKFNKKAAHTQCTLMILSECFAYMHEQTLQQRHTVERGSHTAVVSWHMHSSVTFTCMVRLMPMTPIGIMATAGY